MESLRILFYLIGNEHRNGVVNGDSIREGGTGASGTDQTTIVVAEQLADAGHDVTIAEPNSGVPGQRVRGVRYTDLQFTSLSEEEREFEVLVNTLWFEDFASLPVRVTRAVVSWLHCPYLYGMDPLREYLTRHGLRYGMVNLSKWSADLNSGLGKFLANASHPSLPLVEAVIPNPVMMDVVEKARLQGRTRAPHDLAFHAAWVRGGDLLLRAMEEMQEEDGNWRDARVRVCDYLMQFQAHPLVQNMGSIGKLELLGVLAECQYFVYPLVRFPDGEMHKDTFACVVAEACAMGAVVVTYPVAALPETYGDTVYWMDFPDEVKDVEHLKYKPLSHDTALLTTEPIKKALRYLESHPVEREAMRQRAAALVSEAYSPKAVGSMWVDFMSRLVHP